jgi:hypothetical protein
MHISSCLPVNFCLALLVVPVVPFLLKPFHLLLLPPICCCPARCQETFCSPPSCELQAATRELCRSDRCRFAGGSPAAGPIPAPMVTAMQLSVVLGSIHPCVDQLAHWLTRSCCCQFYCCCCRPDVVAPPPSDHSEPFNL